MSSDEILRTVQARVPLHLATLDARGFPQITPIWFVFQDDAFLMTSLPHKPHVRRLRADGRASVCVDVEAAERPDGQLPNMQVRATGEATLAVDVGGRWTRLITERYVLGEGRAQAVSQRLADERVVIRLPAARVVALASV